MASLGLPSSTIEQIVADPTLLSPTAASASALALTAGTVTSVLDAYVAGFRTVFLLDAGLNAFATVAAFVLIRHADLTRGDEEQLRRLAERAEKGGKDVEAEGVADEKEAARGCEKEKGKPQKDEVVV